MVPSFRERAVPARVLADRETVCEGLEGRGVAGSQCGLTVTSVSDKQM